MLVPDRYHPYGCVHDTEHECVRRWTCTQVNFAGVKNAAEKASQMAISSDGQVLYHPNGSDILPLEAHSGRSLGLLRGHFDRVNCCVFHPHLQVRQCSTGDRRHCSLRLMMTTMMMMMQELYSGGNDNQLLCWVPSTDETELEKEDKAEAADRRSDERPTPAASVAAAAADGDAWSDDDEGDADGDDGAP
jgi:DNA excision repair protein ERCC-8